MTIIRNNSKQMIDVNSGTSKECLKVKEYP